MTLRLHLPHEILFDEAVTKIVAEAENGSFCLLPNHVDFATSLTPGLLTCLLPNDTEAFFAVDRGILVKLGSEVLVSVRNAVRGNQLGELRALVEHEFQRLSEEERRSRAALARLETSLARRFIEFQKHA